MRPVSDPSRAPAVIAFAIGGAGIALGAVTGIIALDKKAELDRNCPSKATCPTTETGARDTAMTTSILSTIALPVGGVGVALGAVLWFTSSKKANVASIGVEPTFGLSSVGLRGRF